MQRRTFIGSATAFAMLGLGGCSTPHGISLAEAIRRLLSISSHRALARLAAPGGFYDNQIARIDLPEEIDQSGKASLLIRAVLSYALRDRLLRQINRAAERGAERAAPVIAAAIADFVPANAPQIIAAGGPAATDLLRRSMGNALFAAILPGIDEGLRLFDNAAVVESLRLVKGIDLSGLRDDVARKASDAIYDAMAEEEMAIRRNPQSSNDPLLTAAFGIGNALR